jgi:hypothetical protein
MDKGQPRFVIVDTCAPDGPLFWSNEDGWVSWGTESIAKYTAPELAIYPALPIGAHASKGVGWVSAAVAISLAARPEFHQFRLVDAEDASDTVLDGFVDIFERGILVKIDGFGTAHDEYPILIEQINGVPIVRVWSDLASEDATHVVGLEKAKVP